MSTTEPIRALTSANANANAAPLTRGTAKAIYRAAIDTGALDREGNAWWGEVVAEVQAVVAAPDTRTAAALIAWWHADWRSIGDTPARAAGRLRRAARPHRDVGGDRGQASTPPEVAS